MDIRFAKRTELMNSSVVRETLKLTARPDIISFAGGMPAPEVFPVEAMRAASDKVLTTAGPTALQYGPSDGCLPLREKIAGRHRREGMACRAEDILMINGSQQGLDLAGKLFWTPGTWWCAKTLRIRRRCLLSGLRSAVAGPSTQTTRA